MDYTATRTNEEGTDAILSDLMDSHLYCEDSERFLIGLASAERDHHQLPESLKDQ